MNIIPFPRHLYAHCTREECYGCHLCAGGLAVCQTCGGAEGSLPTDCPREWMGAEREEAVYAGLLDYRRREGWITLPSPNSPAAYR